LQPAVLSTATAVTDPGRRAAGLAPNRFVCKVRLVE
jgi:hypothetical protein